MNRKISAPVMYSNLTCENRAEYLQQIRKTGTQRLFIAVDRSYMFGKWSEAETQQLADHLRYFEAEGIETGVWMQAFGFGNPLSGQEKAYTAGMTKIKSVTGAEAGDAFCPEDPAYMEMYDEWVRGIAGAEPPVIMLDDDLCLSVRPGIGCFCERHMKLLEERLGRTLNRDDMAGEMFTGRGGEARKAWLDVMGDTLREFCAHVRRTVDAVNPAIRLGFCAGYTSWDFEGADVLDLTRILSGGREPFLRLTGAPYWVAPHWNRFPGQRLHAVIEFGRMQEEWCRGTGVEFFSEADSYPRPRYSIPGSMLECFDTAMVASGNVDVLKYFFDYFSPPGYETGYARMHCRNMPLYDFLGKHFTDKKAVGIQVCERMRKFADMELPEKFSERNVMATSLPAAGAMLAELGIPVTYGENSECAMAFGENVTQLKKLPRKMIVDATAALRLKELGVDTGIEKAAWMENVVALREKFGGTLLSLSHVEGRYFDCLLKNGATVESFFEAEENRWPASFRYDNGETEFLVFTFDGYSVNQSGGVFCSYARQAQILAFWCDFPVVRNAPFLYSLCKRDEKETVVFYANIFEDPMDDFEVELDRDYAEAECFGVEAELCGNRLKVISSVAPFGMFAVRLIQK